jgi:RNA polymerase sigma-70 factor, ECF subfamily
VQLAQTTELEIRYSALQYLDRLYGYALTLTRNPTEAEDLVQETYLRALRAIERLRPDSNVKGWLTTIMRNIRLNHVRSTKAGLVIDTNHSVVATSDFKDRFSKDPHDSYLTKVKAAMVRNAVETLPPRYREVIILREFEDLSYSDIAKVLDCPIGTVTSRLGRAREQLKDLLQPSFGNGD